MRSRLLPLLIVPILLAGCFGGDEEGGGAAQPPGSDDAGAAAPVAPQEATVTVGEATVPAQYTISPARLELVAGVPVNLTFVNAGEQRHDLAIAGLGVAFEAIDGGESASHTFTPEEPGEYEMVCTIGGDGPLGHGARGMRGTVVVTAAA